MEGGCLRDVSPQEYNRYWNDLLRAEPSPVARAYSWLWEDLEKLRAELEKLGLFEPPSEKLLDKTTCLETAAQSFADRLKKIEGREEEARQLAQSA